MFEMSKVRQSACGGFLHPSADMTLNTVCQYSAERSEDPVPAGWFNGEWTVCESLVHISAET